MMRFPLGISLAAVLLGLSVTAGLAQTQPEAAPTTPPAPVQTPTVAPSTAADAAPVRPEGAVPQPAVPAPSASVPTVAPAEPAAAPPSAPLVDPASAPAATPAAAASDAAPAQAPAAAPEGAVAPGAAPMALAPQEPATAEAQPLPSAHDLSPMGMYQQADLVVKSVMILLVVACFLSWTVLLYKLVETAVARGRARYAARVLTRAASLPAAVAELKGRRDPAAFMVQAVAEEYHRSEAAIAPSGAEGVKERAASLVHRVEVQASSRLRRGMGLLATIGSVSPFVGLFGTVWGIMNSFIGIAETQTTNLAVVAPGIAEALFATALGLVAAIPAVVIYNHFTRVIQGYKQNLGDAGAATLRLLSRDVDFRHREV